VKPPFLNLRSFLAFLEERKRLQKIGPPVDKDTELACITRWAIESTPKDQAYALLFENIIGHKVPVAVNLYPTYDLYAGALGISPGELLEHWACALEKPHSPVVVNKAPVHEVVVTGDEVNLDAMPVPVWTPGRGEGPYLAAGMVITKDRDTGVQNLASYRLQIQGPRRLGLFFGSKLQHGAMHLDKYRASNTPMPVAVVVGAAPAVNFAAAAKTAYGVDELAIAGGLIGQGLEVVKGRTVDLLVPAQAEYVIEGLVPPNAQQMEGPFGEALGYMNDAAPAAYIDVTAICHRQSPVHHGYIQQLPPSEGHIVMEMGIMGPLWYYLTRRLHLEGLRGLGIVPGSAGVTSLIVQLDRAHRHKAKSVGKMIAQLNFGQRYIYLVDEDIDIRDSEAIQWALSSRVDPHQDVTVVDGVNAFQFDPAVMARIAASGKPPAPPPYKTSLAIVDATLKCPVPDISLPVLPLMERALSRWGELGLPPIHPRPRITRLLDPRHKNSPPEPS
jgi:2,5-furandicarboxylate decarboxylase 1